MKSVASVKSVVSVKSFLEGRARGAGRVVRGCLVAAAVVLVPACGQPSSGSGAPGASAAAPKPPPPEATMFAPTKAILAELPVMKLVPKQVVAVIAARDPATVVAKLGALSGFGEAKEPLAKELDAAAKEITKDLPELAALAQNGVDLGKPVGVVLFDPELETWAIFAAVSDEGAMKRWLEERAKQSNGKREVVAIAAADGAAAVILRAKKDVTRAVVLRKGHVFWVRSRERYRAEPSGVGAAAEALASTAEAASLGADPAFSKAIGALAFGEQAAAYVNAGWFAESLVATRKAAADGAGKALEAAEAALAKVEAKAGAKKKGAIEEAKAAVESTGRAKKQADEEAKRVEVLALAKDVLPGIAAGVELGEREIKVKAFVATTSAAGGAGAGAAGAGATAGAGAGAVKVLAPIKQPVALFDAALGAGTAVHLAVEPRLFDFVMRHFVQRSAYSSPVWLGRARSSLQSFGVALDKLDGLVDGEVAAAKHVQKVEVAVDVDAGAEDAAGAATAPAVREREGFTTMWGVSDAAAVKLLLDDAWKVLEPTERVTKGLVKRLGEGSFELGPAYPGELPVRVRLAGNALIVTTLPAAADALGDGKAHTTWMAASDHPALKQLAGIEGPSAIVAFDGLPWEPRSQSGRMLGLADMRDFGILSMFGGSTEKGKKLREQRDKLSEQARELESALAKHKDATWKSFAARLGKTVLYARPADGGVAIYGGVFTPEASVTALAEAGIAAWLSVGPRWEKWGELSELRKKIRDLDDRIEADSQKAMEESMSSVLKGLGGRDDQAGILGPINGFGLGDRGDDSAVGGGLGTIGTGRGSAGSGSSGIGGLGYGNGGGVGRGGGSSVTLDKKKK